MHKARAGTQSLEVGFALLDARVRTGATLLLEIGHPLALAVVRAWRTASQRLPADPGRER